MSDYPDLAAIKSWLNITTNTDDEFLAHHLAKAISLIESYTGRAFPKKERTETYRCNCDSRGTFLVLKARPIESIDLVSGMNGWRATDYGLCVPTSGCGGGGAGCEETIVTYTGGFDPIPPEILDVLYNMMGAAHASKGTVASSAGTVRKETVFGLASVEYETGGGAVDTGGSDPMLPAYYASILDSYRTQLV